MGARTPAPQPTPQELVELLKGELETVVRDRVDQEAAYEKQRQYRRLEKADRYCRGLQYSAEEYNADTGMLNWVNVVSPQSTEATGAYDYNVDVIESYGDKYAAVLGTRPFHALKCQPENPNSEVDRAASRMGDLAWFWLRQKWGIRLRNLELFFKQWRAGTIYPYLDYGVDEAMFGTYEQPLMRQKQIELNPGGFECVNCGAKSPQPNVMEGPPDMYGQPGPPQQACPQCGTPMSEGNYRPPETTMVPELAGYKTYPNAGPRLALCTGYTVTVPNDLAAENFIYTPWLLHEVEEHPGVLLQLYGDDLRKHVDENMEIRAPQTDNSTTLHEGGQHARSRAASLTGTSRIGTTMRWRWLHSRYWLSPVQYEYIRDKDKREIAKQFFPKGMRVSMVEGIIVRIKNEASRECWPCAIEPKPGAYVYHDPVCYGLLPQQDIINDSWNLLIAILERVLPSVLADPEVIDEQALKDRSHAAEILFAKAPVGRPLDSAFAKIPPAEFPMQALTIIEAMERNVQEHSGLLPPVWGGSMGNGNKTAEQARNELNQALQQLSLGGEFAGAGWVQIATAAVRLMVDFGSRPITVGMGQGAQAVSEILDVQVLKNGKFYFEADPGIPMTWTERREQVNHIIGQNPELAHALGIDAPENMPVVRDFLLSGMAELRIPNEDLYEYVYDMIRQLTAAQPLPGGVDPMTGMQGEPMPSLPPDEFVDHAAVADIANRWLISPNKGGKERVENPPGFQNVVVWARAHAMMSLPPPGMGPPGAGPPTGGPGERPGKEGGGPPPPSPGLPGPPPPGLPPAPPPPPPGPGMIQ